MGPTRHQSTQACSLFCNGVLVSAGGPVIHSWEGLVWNIAAQCGPCCGHCGRPPLPTMLPRCSITASPMPTAGCMPQPRWFPSHHSAQLPPATQVPIAAAVSTRKLLQWCQYVSTLHRECSHGHIAYMTTVGLTDGYCGLTPRSHRGSTQPMFTIGNTTVAADPCQSIARI